MGIREQDDKFLKNTSLQQGVFNLSRLQVNKSKPEALTQKPSTNQLQVLGRSKIFAGQYHHSIKKKKIKNSKQE